MPKTYYINYSTLDPALILVIIKDFIDFLNNKGNY